MIARIWFFSPSIKLDPQYKTLVDLLDKMTDQSKEPTYSEDLDQPALAVEQTCVASTSAP